MLGKPSVLWVRQYEAENYKFSFFLININLYHWIDQQLRLSPLAFFFKHFQFVLPYALETDNN